MDGSLVRTRYSGSQRLEPFRNGRLHNRKPCFAGSTASHSPSKFTAIRVAVPPTYPHPEPRFDGSLADDRRSAAQQSRAFSQPTSAHRKPRLAMRLLSLTVATHSDPSVRTADMCTSDAPQPRTDLLALTDRTHSKPTLLATAMPTSKPYTSGRHRASNRAKNPRRPPVCPKSPNLPRTRVPLRFDAAAHRQKAQRFESLQRPPIHTRGRRPRPRKHDSSSKRRQPSQIAGSGYYRETRPALARIRSLVPICQHSSNITSYSDTPTLKLTPDIFPRRIAAHPHRSVTLEHPSISTPCTEAR